MEIFLHAGIFAPHLGSRPAYSDKGSLIASIRVEAVFSHQIRQMEFFGIGAQPIQKNSIAYLHNFL